MTAEAGPSRAAPNGADSTAQMMPIRLSTRSGKHSIPDAPYMVPADWRRFQLSELINKVLSYSSPVPFDFIIDEQLLRSSLGAYVQSKGLTEETALEIEYIESILPPQYADSLPHDDWVSDVDLSRKGMMLSTSYAPSVTVTAASKQQLVSFGGGAQSVLSACWLPNGRIATAGMDQAATVWDVPLPSSSAPDAAVAAPRALFHLPLHTAPVASIRSAKASSSLLTAGWDGLVGFWKLDAAYTADGAQDDGATDRLRAKRRRTAPADDAGVRLAPVHVLKGHRGTVARAIFDRTDDKIAYSAGWDHHVRQWDLEVGAQVSARTSSKVLLALDQFASANLLVTGSTDRAVAIWDTRQSTTNISLVLSGHTSQVNAVRAHPTSPVLVASASHDSTVRVWDARSPKQALFVVRRQPDPSKPAGAENKVLCLDWDGQLLAAGGEDKKLELHATSDYAELSGSSA